MSVTEVKSTRWSGEDYKIVLNVAVFFFAVALMGWNIWHVCVLQGTQQAESSYSLWEIVTYWGVLVSSCIAVAALWAQMSDELGDDEEPLREFFGKLGQPIHVYEWIMVPLLMSLACTGILMLVDQIPHRLQVGSGQVRIMDDGRLLSTGQSTVSDRYRARSKAVYVSSERYNVFPAHLSNGYVTHVQVKTELVLQPSVDLARILSRHYTSLRNEQMVEGREFVYETPDGVNSEVQKLLQPAIEDLVRDGSVRRGSGNQADLLIRSRQVTEMRNPSFPSWVKSLKVSDIQVTDWEHTS